MLAFFKISLELNKERVAGKAETKRTSHAVRAKSALGTLCFLLIGVHCGLEGGPGTDSFGLPIHNPVVFAYFMKPTHMRMWRNWQTR